MSYILSFLGTRAEVTQFWEKYLAKSNAIGGGPVLITENGIELDADQITRNYNEDMAYFNAHPELDNSSANKGGIWAKAAASGGSSGGGSKGGGTSPKGSGGNASSGTGGSTKKAPQPETPPIRPLMTSFGKLFCSFCLPPLLAAAYNEDIDEVQVNFYQMNEQCGPISLHSIAEFPILVDELSDVFAARASAKGGESMTVFEFMIFVNEDVFGKKRAPGYGMRAFTEAQDANKPSDNKKDDGADQAKSNKMTEWHTKYGEFKQPDIRMKIDVLYEGEDGDAGVDLLYRLQHTVGAQYNAPPPDFETDPSKRKKRIKRVDIFDTQYDPYKKSNALFKDKDGSYRAFDGNPDDNQRKDFIEAYKRDYAGPDGVNASLKNGRVTIDGVSVGPAIANTGPNILKDYMGDTLPRIEIGNNGTMVLNASVQSKMDSLWASAQAGASSFKTPSTMSPNGLSSAENNLPAKVLPAELSITTMGCPIALACQQFYVDFGTGTTLDNMYSTKQIQHTFAPGKYESSWTFTFVDGYPKFFGATAIADTIKEISKDNKDDSDNVDPPVKPDPPDPTPAPKGTSKK